MEYALVTLKCIPLRLTSTVVTSVVWYVFPFVKRSILPEFAFYQIITSLKYGSLKGSGVNSLHRSMKRNWADLSVVNLCKSLANLFSIHTFYRSTNWHDFETVILIIPFSLLLFKFCLGANTLFLSLLPRPCYFDWTTKAFKGLKREIKKEFFQTK